MYCQGNDEPPFTLCILNIKRSFVTVIELIANCVSIESDLINKIVNL